MAPQQWRQQSKHHRPLAHFAGSLIGAPGQLHELDQNPSTAFDSGQHELRDHGSRERRCGVDSIQRQPAVVRLDCLQRASYAVSQTTSQSRPAYASLPGTQQNIMRTRAPYYEAATEAMDTEIGRLLAAVESLEHAHYFSGRQRHPDAGAAAAVSGRRGKDTLYEGGLHVPLIVAGPAVVNPGRTNETLVTPSMSFPRSSNSPASTSPHGTRRSNAGFAESAPDDFRNGFPGPLCLLGKFGAETQAPTGACCAKNTTS